MKIPNIQNTIIRTAEELSSVYNKLMHNKSNYVDFSTDLLLDSERVLPESITLSKGKELIDDIYFNDEVRWSDYLSVIDSVEANNYDFLVDKSIAVAFHYGATNCQIELTDIINAIKNRNTKDYFLVVFVSNSVNGKTEKYTVKI